MAHLTEKAIMDSFVKLLSEKSFDKITVTDIVEDCQITRRTFYYHYADLYELTEALFRSETERAVSSYEETGSWEESFIRGCRFIMENKRAVYHIFKSAHRAELEKYVDRIAAEVMSRFLDRQAAGLDVQERDKQLVCDFYRCALSGLLYQWLDDSMKEDPEALIHRLGLLFDGNIRRSLERSAAQPK
ncbi:MAG: TetR/AcrR family transcriptional regulator [Oscillospiraceae bacterium]|nr:TetR/AcrR family transcriptional regulator [Oscillospiraceae bacterium]